MRSRHSILLVSEHVLCRHGTAELLRQHGFRVGEAGSLAQLRERHSACVVDLDHVSVDTRAVVEAAIREPCHVVLVGSAHRLGAVVFDGPVVETPSGDLGALVAAINGRKARPSQELARQRKVWTRVTVRQREVMRLLAGGNDNRTIGRELRVGERTVKGHITVLLAAFGADSRTELALLAWRAGLRARGASL